MWTILLAEFETALDLYYQIDTWPDDGIPTQATLTGLGIEWAAEYLARAHGE